MRHVKTKRNKHKYQLWMQYLYWLWSWWKMRLIAELTVINNKTSKLNLQMILLISIIIYWTMNNNPVHANILQFSSKCTLFLKRHLTYSVYDYDFNAITDQSDSWTEFVMNCNMTTHSVSCSISVKAVELNC